MEKSISDFIINNAIWFSLAGLVMWIISIVAEKIRRF